MNVPNTEAKEPIRLTQFSLGGGCGCKISPAVLDEILNNSRSFPEKNKLIVGNDSNDDAAAYDLGNGMAIISTTDFFMPIVDDAFDFGRIAAANSISDIFAMGAQPIMAIAVLGWPIDKLPASLAAQMMEGARQICHQASIPLAGGHSIDSTEPIFGLAVTGLVKITDLKKNNTAGVGDYLFLTKPLGSGILSTAQKRGVLSGEFLEPMISTMTSLNDIGAELGKLEEVTAMTDITGFGILGHLIEMAEGSNAGAELYYNRLKLMDGVKKYLAERITPDATFRNWNSYNTKVKFEPGVNVAEAFSLLPDPQTNGGLLLAVKENGIEKVRTLFKEHGLEDFNEPIGKIIDPIEKSIIVKQGV